MLSQTEHRAFRVSFGLSMFGIHRVRAPPKLHDLFLGRCRGKGRAGAERAHHHLAGVGPDTRLDRHSALRPKPRRVLTQCLLHPQRRVERPLRMVLVRNRGAPNKAKIPSPVDCTM